MLSLAKLFVEIAKLLGVSSGIVTHVLLLILAVGITIPATSFLQKQNSKIQSVPELSAKLDTIQYQMTRSNEKLSRFIIDNKVRQDSLNARIGKGFSEVQNAFIKSRELENQKFIYLDKTIKDKFSVQESWVEEIIDKISYLQIEKKKSNPYLMTSIQ